MVSRKGGVWRAEATKAGRYYLRHGAYPDGLWRGRPARPAAARAHGRARGEPRQAAEDAESSVPPVLGPPVPTLGELAQGMVARVAAAGGAVEVARRPGGFDDLVTAARWAPNLPPGKRLKCRAAGGWSSPMVEMYFDEDSSVRVAERPVPVPARVTAYHRVAGAYREDADRHEVSKGLLGRACRILHALAAEAERRGHLAAVPAGRGGQYNSGFASSLKDGQLQNLRRWVQLPDPHPRAGRSGRRAAALPREPQCQAPALAGRQEHRVRAHGQAADHDRRRI